MFIRLILGKLPQSSSHLGGENYQNVHHTPISHLLEKTIAMFITPRWGKLSQCSSHLCGENYHNVHHTCVGKTITMCITPVWGKTITMCIPFMWGKLPYCSSHFCGENFTMFITLIFYIENGIIIVCTHENGLLMRIRNIPSCYRKSKRSLLCLMTWGYYQPSLAQTIPVLD